MYLVTVSLDLYGDLRLYYNKILNFPTCGATENGQ